MRLGLALTGTGFALITLALGACSDGAVNAGGNGDPNGGGGSGASGDGGPGTGGRGSPGGGNGGGNGGNGGNAQGGNGGGGTVTGRSAGEPCGDDAGEPCRSGLRCGASSTCELAHDKAAGTPCVAAGECESGLQCALGQCVSAGAGAESEGCTLDTDCQGGLRCGLVGFGAQCVPEGTADFGQPCALSGDCLAGLLCAPGAASGSDAGAAASTSCAPIPTTGVTAGIPFGLPVPPVLACAPPSTGNVQAYFEVPGADGSSETGDFFRLPFPNDVRIEDGKIDLDGFPTPGATLLGFDPVRVYLDAVTENESAWGAYATVLFRFSGPIDFGTLRAVDGQPSPVQYLDITNPNAIRNGGAQWGYSPQGGKYICHNWLAVRRHDGSPLEPGRTYVVYLSTQARDARGIPIEASPQLKALLDIPSADAAPLDPALANAHAKFAPFRAYLAAESIDPATILNATVITTAPFRTPMENVATAVAAAVAPTASGWVKCGGTATSPCPQATADRACGATSADFDEYHALISLPIFQKGTAPYLTSGGDMDTQAPVRTEDVCAALTVPKGAPPTAGFPLVVFAHGTGGSFRSHVRDEVAGALATATSPMAVLGYDQVQHGPRRGASSASPNRLFFNVANPLAARGNPLQGAADVLSVGRLARGLTVPASATGAAAIAIDPSRVAFFGHSQGSMHGSLALPHTNDYAATVLSGNGASLMHALLSKTEPENIAQGLPFLLGGDFDQDFNLFGGTSHPALAIVQQWIDPADPLNFARPLTRDRYAGITPKSVFQTYGQGDTYSPPSTMRTYAAAAVLDVAAHDPSVTTPDPIANFSEVPVPLAGNYAAGPVTVTLAVRQYVNEAGKDGHFVAFDLASANQDVVRFLSMNAAGQVPAVGE